MATPFARLLLVPALALAAVACDGDGGTGGTPPSDTISPLDVYLTGPLVCDPLDERACLLPWPNDAFTIADPSTPTGRRLAIVADSTPLNAEGVAIDVTDQNRADGFSPGSSILAFVPGLDVEASGIAPSTDIGASLADDSPIVVLDTDTGRPIPYWAELDAQAPEGDQVLIVHPASSLPEGHHFIVAMRHLVDTEGNAIERTPAFQAALDQDPEPLERARTLREMLEALDAHGVDPDVLYLAWEFTVASEESLSSRLLHMRDEAYTGLGDGAPEFTVTASTANEGVRTIDGTFDVPNYLTGDGSPGNRFELGADGLPEQNTDQPVLPVPFHCVVPDAAAQPVPAIVFGHGLMGDRGQADGLSFAAANGLAAVCAIDEIGMSTEDVPNLAAILADLSHFPEQADRLQQGHLNQQFLGRLLNSPDGFVSDPAFQTAGGAPIIANGETQFVGNSQGGILGGAASAISTEWSRVVLGVPGINYSLLLPRSSDWPQFQVIFDQAYTDPADRLIALQLIQLLWDRGENSGYAQHLTTNPYPGIEAKQVLLVQAFGDHQVANVATEVLARTIGATVREPALDGGRSADVDPQWGIEAFDLDYPSRAILVVWDYGTPAPPTVNLPPTEPEYGEDPHGAGSREPLVLQQALTFLFTGEFTNPCGATACRSTALTG
jgi:hypothetical protein